jgi:hypothetical protein
MNTKILMKDELTPDAGSPGFPMPCTRKVLRKLRGTRQHKCAAAFFAVQEAIKCR